VAIGQTLRQGCDASLTVDLGSLGGIGCDPNRLEAMSMATKKRAKEGAGGRARGKTAMRRPAKRARRVRKQPESLRMQSASPGFTVNDVEKSVAWYRDVMGFVVKDRWEHEGKLVGVEMVAGNVIFMLGQDDWKKGRDRVKGEGFRMYCTTGQDVDLLAIQIKARGGRLIQEPRDESWGMRDFAVADPDGFKITIGAATKKR
jgi:uncharacterized glyoxalase superfamily protein PhnB